MTIAERNKNLRIVAELLQVHLPAALEDQPLAHDLLSVVGMTLRAVYEDALHSSDVWDRKHYHLRADLFRDEWTWALAAANTAEGLADRAAPVTPESLERLRRLIRAPLEVPARRLIRHPEAFRGAAQANRARRKSA
jgi:hypothetical protein